jgi:fermentation-respiration switch protein FrsA (DUF1100 family)
MKDKVVPVTMSQRLFAAAPEPKKLLLMPNAGHNNLAQVDSDRYMAALQEFLSEIIHQQRTINQEVLG